MTLVFYYILYGQEVSFYQIVSFIQQFFQQSFLFNSQFLFINYHFSKTSFFSTRSSFLTIIFFFLSFLYRKAVPLKAALLQQRERFFACYISIHSAMRISASITNAVANVHLVLCGFLYKTVYPFFVGIEKVSSEKTPYRSYVFEKNQCKRAIDKAACYSLTMIPSSCTRRSACCSLTMTPRI